MKPAPCSCRVRISLILVERDRLSRKSRFSSPGTPKTYSTPSSSRHWMNRSDALVIEVLVGRALEKRPAIVIDDEQPDRHDQAGQQDRNGGDPGELALDE